MAKPIPAGRAGCSARSTSYSRPPNLEPHHPPRRRRRLPSSNGPSSALLSLLATISASSTSVHGSPAPPSFLCPSLERRRPSISSRGDDPPKTPRSSRLAKKPSGSVPDKFEVDDNGRWRRVESYSLYGSTICLTCLDSSTTVPSVDDQIQAPPVSSPTPTPTPSPTASFNIHDNLPAGWKAPTGNGGSRTTLILALSMVLAFFICFLIIGCLFWRKSARRRRRQDDIEMKARKRRRSQMLDEDSDRQSMVSIEKEAQTKKKIWARATARWKANARYTARQRRGKRTVTMTRASSPQGSCISLDATQDTPSMPNPSPSINLSHRSSLESMYAETQVADATNSAPSSQGEIQPDENRQPLPSSHSPPPLPPAYHRRISAPPSSDVCPSRDDEPSLSLSFPGSHYTSSPQSPSIDPQASGDEQYSEALHAAHVATDDKTLLARLANLASSPPQDRANSSQDGNNQVQVSVPIWQDEELGDFGDVHEAAHCALPLSEHSSRSTSPAPLFPPPPSKGKMAANNFYDYPYSFDDILVAEPDPGPSAPPFEAEPSHPPIDEAHFVPSAPPLSDVDSVYFIESHASAPSQHWEACVAPACDDSEQPQSSDTIPDSHITPLGAGTLEHPVSLSTTSIQGPVASDGTPPCYHR